ncbi:response regulator [Bradyrhizobium sp. STM 3562]|uniref:response regulator n=1 Tax=Bradyrhizobium sp. STM 3562 TaxID=578924 RepID=UPI003890431B
MLVEDALCGGGFQAEIALSGEAAFSLFSGNRGGYRALITDISVGAGLNGWTLARQIREIEPDFPVVYMTKRRRRCLEIAGDPEQRPHRKAIRARATDHRHLPASERGTGTLILSHATGVSVIGAPTLCSRPAENRGRDVESRKAD